MMRMQLATVNVGWEQDMPQRPWTRGRKGTTIHLHEPEWDMLKDLSITLKMSQNSVIAEAIRVLFDAVAKSNKQHVDEAPACTSK